MGKAVKKIAKIAVPVALGFAGAGALGYGPMKYAFGMGGYSPGGFFGSVSTAISKFGGVGNALQAGGLAMNIASNIQSQKYAGKQSSFAREQVAQQNKAEEARNRYNQLLQKRSRLQSIRAARIQQGQIGAATAGTGLGATGTSSFTGSMGAIGSQTSANLGNINVAQDVGNQISGYNIAAANAGSQANTMGARSGMFSNYASLGGTLLTEGKGIANIFGKE